MNQQGNLQTIDFQQLQLDLGDQSESEGNQHLIFQNTEQLAKSQRRKQESSRYSAPWTKKDQVHFDPNDDRLPVNLKGLKVLFKKRSQNQQLSNIIQKLRQNSYEIVFAGEPAEEVKISDDCKMEKLQDIPRGGLKIEQFQQEQTAGSNGEDLLGTQPKLALIVTAQMRQNYNNHARVIYYTELINKQSEDLNISGVCISCNSIFGIVYGFTHELRPIIFSVYCIFNMRENYNYSHVLLPAFLRANASNISHIFQRITFCAQSLIDIPKLEGLASQLKRQGEKNQLKIPIYDFVIDPAYIQTCELLSQQDFPQRNQLQMILNMLLECRTNADFASNKNKLHTLLIKSNLNNTVLNSGYTIRQIIECFFRSAKYTCLSQMTAMIGPVQWIITAPILLYITASVIERLVQVHIQENKKKVNRHGQALQEQKVPLIEGQVPQLAFLKQQTSKLIYDYILQQIVQCGRWQVTNERLQQQIHYFRLQLQQQDELYYQQYQALPQFVRKIKSKQYYKLVSKDKKWICECNYSRIYGIPCMHEIKICLLAANMLRNQIEETFLHEEYYERCNVQKLNQLIKYDSMKRKDEIILTPLGTQDGRQQLINFRTKHRMMPIKR